MHNNFCIHNHFFKPSFRVRISRYLWDLNNTSGFPFSEVINLTSFSMFTIFYIFITHRTLRKTMWLSTGMRRLGKINIDTYLNLLLRYYVVCCRLSVVLVLMYLHTQIYFFVTDKLFCND
jgi:hypothetical protein